jgi:desulfoferrodoxin-like iron-binding protein
MIALRQIWHCPLCGNVVEAVFAGLAELVCCGQPMKHWRQYRRRRQRKARPRGNDLGVQDRFR